MSLSNILGGALIGLGQGYESIQDEKVKRQREDQKAMRDGAVKILTDPNTPPSQRRVWSQRYLETFGIKDIAKAPPELQQLLGQLNPTQAPSLQAMQGGPPAPSPEGPPVPTGVTSRTKRPSPEEFAQRLGIPYISEDERWAADQQGFPIMYRQHLTQLDEEERQRRLAEEGEKRKQSSRDAQIKSLEAELSSLDLSKLDANGRIMLGVKLSAKYPDIPADTINRIALGEQAGPKQSFEEATFTDFTSQVKAGTIKGYSPDRVGFMKWKADLSGEMGEQFTPEALEVIARAVSNGAPLPAFGMGKAATAARIMVWNRAAQLNPSLDLAKAQIGFSATKTGTGAATREFAIGTESDQIASYRTFLRHADDLANFSKQSKVTSQPWANRPLNYLRRQTGDPIIQAYMAKMEPVRKEFEAFLLNNRALYTIDREEGLRLISEELSPAALEAGIKSMIHTAAARMDTIGLKYESAFGKPASTLFDQRTKEILKKFGETPSVSTSATPPPGGVEITTRAQFDSLPDGAVFTKGGKSYRKQGTQAIPEAK